MRHPRTDFKQKKTTPRSANLHPGKSASPDRLNPLTPLTHLTFCAKLLIIPQ